MAHGIYVSMTQAESASRRLDQVADALANKDTPGFVTTLVRTVGDANPVTDIATPDAKSMAHLETDGANLRAGPIEQTGRPLDVALPAGHFLSVLESDGQPAFTRAGNLAVDETGALFAAGRPVLDEAGLPVYIPAGGNPSLNQDGQLRFGNRHIGDLPVFAAKGPMQRVSGDTLRLMPGGAARRVLTEVTPGALEGSNASPLRAVTDLVHVQQSFAHAMQAIDTYAKLDRAAIELGKIR